MERKYSISLAVDGVEMTPGFFGWLLHRVYSNKGEDVLFVAYTEDSCFGGSGRALRFPRVDDAVEALRDVDESGRVEVCW